MTPEDKNRILQQARAVKCLNAIEAFHVDLQNPTEHKASGIAFAVREASNEGLPTDLNRAAIMPGLAHLVVLSERQLAMRYIEALNRIAETGCSAEDAVVMTATVEPEPEPEPVDPLVEKGWKQAQTVFDKHEWRVTESFPGGHYMTVVWSRTEALAVQAVRDGDAVALRTLAVDMSWGSEGL